MKDSTKRKMKKTIYAAIVLSYILIITTVTTQAAVVFDAYKVTNPKIEYTTYNVDEDNITYNNGIQLTIGVDKISNSSVNLYMVYDIDPNKNFPFQVREIDGYGIYYDMQMQGTSTKQGVWTTKIYNTAGTLITVNVKATKQVYNKNQLMMVYSLTSSSSTMYNAIYYFNECEKYNDLHPGEILITYLTLRGVALSSNNYISVYEKTANEIIEDTLGEQVQNQQEILDILNQDITINPIEHPNPDQEILDFWEEFYNKNEVDEYNDLIQASIDYFTAGTTYLTVSTILTEIISMPYIVLCIPIATFILIWKAILH